MQRKVKMHQLEKNIKTVCIPCVFTAVVFLETKVQKERKSLQYY